MVRYVYDAWGNHKIYLADGTEIYDNHTGVVAGYEDHIGNVNPFRYRGYNFDTDLNLYYLKTRYYDPETGRFISPDSVDFLDPDSINGLNLYAYCNNNPVMYADPIGHFALWIFLGFVAISALAGAIDGGITAVMSEQNFWKGFFAGAIGGAVGGAINYFLPGAGNLLGRAASTMIYDITNEIFQTGSFDVENLGLYFFDALLDVTYSLLYLEKVGSISSQLISAAVCGAIDAGVDIMQTLLYFSPQAQKRIRGTNNKNSRINSIYSNNLSYVY